MQPNALGESPIGKKKRAKSSKAHARAAHCSAITVCSLVFFSCRSSGAGDWGAADRSIVSTCRQGAVLGSADRRRPTARSVATNDAPVRRCQHYSPSVDTAHRRHSFFVIAARELDEVHPEIDAPLPLGGDGSEARMATGVPVAVAVTGKQVVFRALNCSFQSKH